MSLKAIFKSKTIWFSILLAVLSVIQGYIGLLPLTPLNQMYVGIGISVAVVILRAVTTQPLSSK